MLECLNSLVKSQMRFTITDLNSFHRAVDVYVQASRITEHIHSYEMSAPVTLTSKKSQKLAAIVIISAKISLVAVSCPHINNRSKS